jgi:rhodanese-related sulfurtransferase
MVNRKIVKVSSFRYTILAFIFIILAGGLVLLPKYEKHEGIDPQDLLSKSISPERYISTDKLADRIINQDPSYLLIDVRDSISYATYTLPNALNIPLNELLKKDNEMFVNQAQYNVVFFSNDDFYANQAWILCNRLGYKNLHVLKGGVNQWFNTIINPPVPAEDVAAIEHELYSSRKAASMYFGVIYPDQIKSKPVVVKPAAPKKVITIEKKKKAPAEGGC